MTEAQLPPSDMAVCIVMFAALSTGKLSTDAAKELYLKLLDDADTRTAGLPLSGSGGNVGRTGAQARGSAP
jgi:hypothetical protein